MSVWQLLPPGRIDAGMPKRNAYAGFVEGQLPKITGMHTSRDGDKPTSMER